MFPNAFVRCSSFTVYVPRITNIFALKKYTLKLKRFRNYPSQSINNVDSKQYSIYTN